MTYSAGTSTGCSITDSTLSVTDASGTCDISATKAEDNNYNAATSAEIAVTLTTTDQAALTVVATPSTVPYGTTSAMSTTGGNGTGVVTYSAGTSTGCSITGSTLSVTDASGTCSVSATRAADNNYNAATSVEVVVTLVKANQSILFTSTAPTNAAVAGTPYTPTAISTHSLPVSLSIDPAASQVCAIATGDVSFQTQGICVINANQTGGNNYNAAPQVQQSFAVHIGIPVITWDNPMDIVYPAALSAAQLNATANVPGTFLYDPTLGQVLSVGAHTLHVDFSPTDSINYGNAAKDVSINVTPPPAPTITSISLDIGPTIGNSPVVITGTNFTGGTVSFGGTAATCTVDSDTQITCTTPAHTVGAVDVAVTTPGGITTPNSLFTYVGAVYSIFPNFGPTAGGTTVTILDSTGVGFIDVTAVTFGGIPAASFKVDSAIQITAVTPAHVSSMVDVTVNAPTGSQGNYNYPGGFTYYGADIPLALISIPVTGSTLPFSESPSQLQVGFNVDILHVSASDADWASSAINPANYLLVSFGPNGVLNTQSCLAGIQGDDERVTINSVSYDLPSHTVTLNINNGLPLSAGNYQLLACGTTSIRDLNGVKLNAGLQDTRFTFVIDTASDTPTVKESGQVGILPATGFAPNQVTLLPKQDVPYAGMGDLWLEIPSLSVRMNIVGVPQTEDSWDVKWLGKDAGYLAGSAYPTHSGNSVLTGHVWDARNQPGPFVNLGKLKYGNLIKIHASGQVYTYEVRENRLIGPRNVNAVMKHEELTWVTLLTCETYNSDSGSYAYRRMVKAVLISVD